MPRPPEYQLILGNMNEAQSKLSELAKTGWKPILMSAVVNSHSPTSQVQAVILAEHIIE
jgi:hypothetical protein